MPHIHHCKVCMIPVANCSDDSCKGDEGHGNAGEHYCSIHHPAEHKVEQAAPPPRYAVLVKDQKAE